MPDRAEKPYGTAVAVHGSGARRV